MKHLSLIKFTALGKIKYILRIKDEFEKDGGNMVTDIIISKKYYEQIKLHNITLIEI